MRRTDAEALALGLIHGPVEMVPVSSSGHVAALPWLLGWEVSRWDGARRKELEVALHTGSLAALLLLARPARVRPVLLSVALLPPAVVGVTLERRIEERLGTPATLAAGLLGGGLSLVLADRSLATRDDRDALLRDALALGLAQATALIPGVSRNGATLAAGRALGFSRPGASRLSWEVGLPVMVGATVLKGVRVRRRGAAQVRPLAIGAGAAYASTLAAVRLIGIERRRPLWRWALWRALLAAAILAVRHNRPR